MQRFAVWIVATGLTVYMLTGALSAQMVERGLFHPDSSLRRVDSVPPGKPVLSVRKIWRGYGSIALPGGLWASESESDGGSVTFSLGFPDAHSRPRGRFGYTFHFVDGNLPAGLDSEPHIFSVAMRGDSAYPYMSWDDGATWEQDAFSFHVYVTAIDSAGNESLPSNTIMVTDDGKQEERRQVKFEQKYLVFSSNRQQAASWTGTDESGTPASLTEVSYGNIELRNGMSVMIGSYLMQGGDGPGKPHRIDIYDNMEMGPQLKQLGIYEMHGDSLRLCLAAPGDYRPNAFHQSGGARLYRLKKSTP